MAERVIVNEVGLRDGLQNQPRHVETATKLALARSLLGAGLTHFEITSFVSPKAVPQMADAEALLAELPAPDNVTFTALVPNERGYERAASAGVKSVAVVLAATETLNRRNINMSLAEATSVCETVVRRAKADGRGVRAYIAAACACPYEGVTPLDTVLELSARMMAAGADEIAIADTIGAGHPRQVKQIFEEVIGRYGSDHVAAHFHDTRGMGLALAWAALEAGVRRFDSSFGGLGGCPFAPGASGNLATEDLVFMLQECGFETGIDFPALVDAVESAGKTLDLNLGGKILPWYRGRRQQGQAITGKAQS